MSYQSWPNTVRHNQQRQFTAAGSAWWKLLGGMGLVMLLLALLMNPGSARPVNWEEPAGSASAPAGATTVAQSQPAAPMPAPTHTSLLDIIGKVSLAVLLIYGVSFGLNRARAQGWLPLLTSQVGPGGSAAAPGAEKRLQLSETLVLGRQQGTLYLLECEGRAMLVGLTGDQLQLLWSAAEGVPATPLSLLEDKAERPGGKALPKPGETALELPLFKQGFGQPARKESDWARERSRLISALVQAE